MKDTYYKDGITNILSSYSLKPNTAETRQFIINEMSSFLLSSPDFRGTIIDKTSMDEEAKGLMNFKIKLNGREYTISEYGKLIVQPLNNLQ